MAETHEIIEQKKTLQFVRSFFVQLYSILE